MPRLPDFKAQYPQYTIWLRAGLGFEEMNNGQLDMAIRMGAGGWDGMQQIHLMDEQLLVVAAPSYQPRPTSSNALKTATISTIRQSLGRRGAKLRGWPIGDRHQRIPTMTAT
ncbi:LysR substrate-binding domain-containing protein [uncultured Deefgea sp.]|uniref:LysR substrate-binding domain-containing protein n=1 Tax=uncultured Deefgea sp. TaxID=1304914 RepID=UPI00261634EE|nr:LysR substrate-binding domain-containing protein [uncultured Deefgea sp.]